jgi:hypothetical protein
MNQPNQGGGSGLRPDVGGTILGDHRRVPLYVLHHHHEAEDCPAAYAAWKGFDSPLRRGVALASCRHGGHSIWWNVEASDDRRALELLPPYVAARSKAFAVSNVDIP